MAEKACKFMVLDGDEKSLKRKIEDYKYPAGCLSMPMLPGTSGSMRTIWWFSAATLYNEMTSGKDKLLYWGSGRFIDSFLKESAKWDERTPYFWSYWDRTTDKGVPRFNGSFGLYMPSEEASYIGELPQWLGNRFLLEYLSKKLSSKGIPIQKRGKSWPSCAEELSLTKGQERITLAMIVKNEEQFLAGCLEQALPYIDDIVVVDTGSTDETINIAKMYGAKIVKHVWQDDFAAARNAYMEVLPEGFALCLDADEFILPETGVTMRALAGNKEEKVYYFNTFNYTSDVLSQFNVHANVRLFYKNKNPKYVGRIHEQLDTSVEKCNVSDSVVLHYGYLSKIVQMKKKQERNTDLLETATKEQGRAFDFFNKGIAMFAYSRFQDAFDAFAKYFEIQDQNMLQYYPCAYWQAANAALMIEKRENALELANKACESNLSEAFFVRGGIYEKLGEREKALEDYVKASESTQDSETFKLYNLLDPSIKIWRANYLAASILENMGRIDEAEQRYKYSHEGDKKNVLPILALARISRNRGKYAQALLWAKKALEHAEEAFDVKIEYIESLVAFGSYDEAFAFAKLCVEKTTVYLAIYLKLAELFRNGGRLDHCCEALDRYFKLNPENINITIVYARCLAENGLPEKALSILDRDWPEDLDAETLQKIHIAIGIAHHACGKDFDALDAYANAFDLGDDNPELLSKIALSMAMVDRLEDSLAALDRLATIAPDYPGSQKLLELINLKVKSLA
jgi:tetratricopeptide (TPR) repeat protein